MSMTTGAIRQSDLAAARELAALKPLDKKLYEEILAQAKKKFAAFPSFAASIWVQQQYRKRGGKFAGGSGAKSGNPFAKASADPSEPTGDATVDGVPVEELTTIEGEDPTRLDIADRPAGPGVSGGEVTVHDHRVDSGMDEPIQRSKAFVTEHAGRTLLTGPATTIPGGFEKALNANPHMLWMQGRLVGAETPNRNKALWTAGDLELGNATVAHGPLNWLHEARHVIGSIAGSRMVSPGGGGVGETAAESRDPHIVAAASVWRWLYPDEAMVVEQASELNHLWFSMECVSESVVCAGQNGCGTEIGYVDYATNEKAGCEHLQARSGVRRFANPTFLGAAVIVPPTRPGWADADARVMQQASLAAEKAFEQAGQPDVKASDFEQIVAQVLRFAE